jgi:hypothetical protein
LVQNSHFKYIFHKKFQNFSQFLKALLVSLLASSLARKIGVQSFLDKNWHCRRSIDSTKYRLDHDRFCVNWEEHIWSTLVSIKHICTVQYKNWPKSFVVFKSKLTGKWTRFEIPSEAIEAVFFSAGREHSHTSG